MQISPKITFHNMDPSDAVETRIREKIDKLDKRFNGLLGCSVVVEAAHHHQQKGRLYSVRIDLTLPRGELVVSHHPGKNPRLHDKVFAAMNTAFRAIDRKLERFKNTSLRPYEKYHEPNVKQGVVSNIFPHENFGFLSNFDGTEIYFHKNAVHDDRFSELDIGEKVRYVLAEGEGIKGPQASLVRLSRRKSI